MPLQRGGDYVAPRDAVEQTLAKLWSDLLKLDESGHSEMIFSNWAGTRSSPLASFRKYAKNSTSKFRCARFSRTRPSSGWVSKLRERQAATIASEDVEQLLSHLEALPEESAEQQSIETNGASRELSVIRAGRDLSLSPFACPTSPIRAFWQAAMQPRDCY